MAADLEGREELAEENGRTAGVGGGRTRNSQITTVYNSKYFNKRLPLLFELLLIMWYIDFFDKFF